MAETLRARDVYVTYNAPVPVHALRGVDLSADQGEFLAVVGPSGGGKSTLLNVLGAIQSVDSGSLEIAGHSLTRASPRDVAALRSQHVAFVFQDFHLLPGRPAVDSVELPLFHRRIPAPVRRAEALAAMDRLGIGHLAHQNASTLSGGQQQRVAIARALASRAQILLADEPTGNLDSENSSVVLQALTDVVSQGITVVVVTHEAAVAATAQRVLRIEDGRITEERAQGQRTDPATGRLAAGKASAPDRLAAQGEQRLSGLALWRDRLQDAWVTLTAHRSRSLALAGVVGAAVALIVGVQAVSDSASRQVSAEFDQRANRHVTAEEQFRTDSSASLAARDPQATIEAVSSLAGVTRVAVLEDYNESAVFAQEGFPSVSIPVLVGWGDVEGALDLLVRWGPGQQPGGPHVLIGTYAASKLELGPVTGAPWVNIDGRVLQVTGIIESSPRIQDLGGSIILVSQPTSPEGQPSRRVTAVTTIAGAAQPVASQLALVIDPVSPERVGVIAPPDPRDLREGIESSVRDLLQALSLIAALAATVGMSSAMLLAVGQRVSELALRRAVGATRADVARQLITEALLLGLAGGVIGLFAGLSVAFGVSIVSQWSPEFDARIVPLALAIAVVVAGVSGCLAALRAIRVDPAQALRR